MCLITDDNMTKNSYYRLDSILKESADYNLIFGERGNGKTYAVQEYAIKDYLKNGRQIFMLRRWVEDVKEKNAQNFWDGKLLNRLSDLSDGQFTNIEYKVGKYYLCTYDSKGRPILNDDNVIGYVWSISEAERLKGQSFPSVGNIVYEEFISLSREGYHPEELTMFLNIVSTIVRDRTDVQIWMLGNTVNKFNPYFDHFGVRGKDLKQGQIWTKTDSETGCKVAFEFCAKRRKGSLYGTSAKYYAFGTGIERKMIVNGGWQTPDYPKYHYPDGHSNKIGVIGVLFDGHKLELSLLSDKGSDFIHIKEVKNFRFKAHEPKYYVVSLTPEISTMYRLNIDLLPNSPFKDRVIYCLNNGKVFYEDNDSGEYFNNFYRQSELNSPLV